MTQHVLILGANGRFGRHASRAFRTAGWTVHVHDRANGDLIQSAHGKDVIVNAWNPPYPAWQKTVPALTRQVIAAARASGATVIVPGNVYVYGETAPQVFSADTPHAATHPLGRVRVEMEAAYRASGVRTIVLRAGDFIDTRASGNWFDAVITKTLHRGTVTSPGATDCAHAWAWLPDLVRAAVVLADQRAALPSYADIPFPGYTLSMQDLTQALSAATGRSLRLRQMSWLPIQLARPVWPMARHLLEMRYLWNRPHQLDGAAFQSLVPGFQATPLLTALHPALFGTAPRTVTGRNGTAPKITASD